MGIGHSKMLRNFALLRTGEYSIVSSYDELKVFGLTSDIADAIERIADKNDYRIHEARLRVFEKSEEFRPQALLIGYLDYRFDKKMPHMQALFLKEDNNVFPNVENIVNELVYQKCLTPADMVLLDQTQPEFKSLEKELKKKNIEFAYDGNPEIDKLLYRVAEQLDQSIVRQRIPKEKAGFYKATKYEQIISVLSEQANKYLAEKIVEEVKKGRFVVQLLPLKELFMGISTTLSNIYRIPNISITPKRLK